MNQQIDIYGVFLPTLALIALGAVPVSALLRRLFARIGLYRWVWHRPLFDFALYVSVLGLGVIAFGGPGA